MRHHIRLLAVLAVCAIAYGILIDALHWMNQPRDSAVAGGIAIIFVLIAFVPLVVRTIWRKL